MPNRAKQRQPNKRYLQCVLMKQKTLAGLAAFMIGTTAFAAGGKQEIKNKRFLI